MSSVIIHPFLPSENTSCCSQHGYCHRFIRTLPRGKIGACLVQYELIYLSDALASLWVYFLVMWRSDDIRYFQIHFESKDDDSVICVQFWVVSQLCWVIGKMLGATGKLFAPILQVTTGQLWIQGWAALSCPGQHSWLAIPWGLYLGLIGLSIPPSTLLLFPTCLRQVMLF